MGPGVPNTIEASRFRSADVVRCASLWHDVKGGHSDLIDLGRQLPVAVAPDQQQRSILEGMAQDLAKPKKAMPWWVPMVCEHRDLFSSMGILFRKIVDGEGPTFSVEIFIITLAVQLPVALTMLQGTLHLTDLPAMEDGGAEEVFDPMLFVARYDVSDLRYVDAADISADDDAEILVLPNLAHKPGEVVTMAQPIPFDEFCRYLPRKPARAPSSGSSSRVKAVPVGVAERMREFFPWLTDDDIKAAHEKAQRKLEDLDAKGGHDGRHLAPEDLEEEAFAKVMGELERQRGEWNFEDDEVAANFYTLVAGGNWTKKFKGVAADSVSARCRAHVKVFCDRFHWPKMKVFHFSAHGELGANTLAREWCRKGHHYFSLWVTSVGAERFANPGELVYPQSLEFLDWAVGVDVNCQSFAKIVELGECYPRL
jgi:hypothetical protein